MNGVISKLTSELMSGFTTKELCGIINEFRNVIDMMTDEVNYRYRITVGMERASRNPPPIYLEDIKIRNYKWYKTTSQWL